MSRNVASRKAEIVREAEKRVVGYALRYADGRVDLLMHVHVEDFHHYAHRIVWEAVGKLVAAGAVVDAVTMADFLNSRKTLEDAGGSAYLVDLWESAPAASPAAYVKIVRANGANRHYREALAAVLGQLETEMLEEEEVEEVVERLQMQLRLRRQTKLMTMTRAGQMEFEELDQRAGGARLGLTYGFPRLDGYTGGMHRKELIIVAARPSVGKSMFAMHAAIRVAEVGGGVLMCSIEQSAAEFAERVFALKSRMSSLKFRTADFSEYERDGLQGIQDSFSKWNLDIDDHPYQNVARILSQARLKRMRSRLDLVIIDYLGLIEPEDRRQPRAMQIGDITRRLKMAAAELDVPIMLVSQLNRDADERVPRLSDLRESGSIEQDADCVLMLHRSADPDSQSMTQDIELHIGKQRHGPVAKVKLIHSRQFYGLAEAEAAEQNLFD